MAQHGFPGICGYYTCDSCGGVEERVMSDSWTGMELCFMCISEVINHVTMSPDEDEGDNLRDRLRETGRLVEDEDEVTA